jgi:hypothetical protein
MYRKLIVARNWIVLLRIEVDEMLRLSDDERRREMLGRYREDSSVQGITCIIINRG